MYNVGKIQVETRREALAVTVGSLVLVHVAAVAFSWAGRSGRQRLQRWMEFWWAPAVLRILRVHTHIAGTE